QVFGTAIQVASLGARFLPILDIAGDNALGRGAKLQPLVACFQAQRGAQPRNVYFGTQAEANPRRLGEQFRGEWALLELFGEWGHGLRPGALTLARPVGAFRVVLHPPARFQELQVIFQIREKTRSIPGASGYFPDRRENSSLFTIRYSRVQLPLPPQGASRRIAPFAQ